MINKLLHTFLKKLAAVSDRNINIDKSKVLSAAYQSFNLTKNYLNQINIHYGTIKDANIMEIGCGQNYGTALILKSLGANSVYVIDPYSPKNETKFNLFVYEKIEAILRESGIKYDSEVFERYRKNSVTQNEIIIKIIPAECIDSQFHGIDIVLSNAVFEHLYDAIKVSSNLYNCMNIGGIGLHQVDFRDHRNFDAPLEKLLLSEYNFVEIFKKSNGECGSRILPYQLEEIFLETGFNPVKFTPNMFAEERYLDSLLKRLSAQKWNTFSHLTREQIQPISGLFFVSKPKLKSSADASRKQ